MEATLIAERKDSAAVGEPDKAVNLRKDFMAAMTHPPFLAGDLRGEEGSVGLLSADFSAVGSLEDEATPSPPKNRAVMTEIPPSLAEVPPGAGLALLPAAFLTGGNLAEGATRSLPADSRCSRQAPKMTRLLSLATTVFLGAAAWDAPLLAVFPAGASSAAALIRVHPSNRSKDSGAAVGAGVAQNQHNPRNDHSGAGAVAEHPSETSTSSPKMIRNMDAEQAEGPDSVAAQLPGLPVPIPALPGIAARIIRTRTIPTSRKVGDAP